MRFIINTLVASFLIVSLLSACGGNKEDDNNPPSSSISSQHTSHSSSALPESSSASSLDTPNSSNANNSSSFSSASNANGSSKSTTSSISSTASSSSVPALVPNIEAGQTQYADMCDHCHGASGEGFSTVPALIGQCVYTDCQDQNTLASYIAEQMPPPGGSCSGNCPVDIAAYIIQVLQSDASSTTAQPGSWNLDTASCSEALENESQRLLPVQIANSLEAVFERSFTAELGFPEPDPSAHFSTGVGSNRIARGDIRDISDSADAIALALLDDLHQLASCGDVVNDNCALDYIQQIAPEIYRGVYATGDIANIETLYQTLRSGTPSLEPQLALAGTISAMIQSPAFLYLLEIGNALGDDQRRLTPREAANRIAYLLTNAPPDDELLSAMETLNTPTGRRTQAERLMSQQNQGLLNLFFEEWMGISHVSLEDRVTPSLATAFRGEFDLLIHQSINEDQPISSLFSRSTTFVNEELAEFYGLNPVEDWSEVNVPSERSGGLLTTALVATAHSNLGGTSVIQRGHFVREELLCFKLGSPPPGATELNPVLPPTATVREQIDARGQVDGCGVCHQQMDPIGIGMEDFDDLGRVRSHYDLSGYPVDSEGGVANLLDDVASNTTSNPSFSGTADLAQTLAGSPALTMCAREQWFTFAMGSSELSQCHSASVSLINTNDTPRSLVYDLIESPRFMLRADSTNTGDENSTQNIAGE